MSELWPMDAGTNLERGPTQPLRSFKCLLLMPFEDHLDRVAALIKSTVIEVFDRFRNFGLEYYAASTDWIGSPLLASHEALYLNARGPPRQRRIASSKDKFWRITTKCGGMLEIGCDRLIA